VRGRKGEKADSAGNLVLPSVAPDAGASAVGGRLLVRGRTRGEWARSRASLRCARGGCAAEARGGFETEPNDDAAHASALVEARPQAICPWATWMSFATSRPSTAGWTSKSLRIQGAG